MVQILPPLILPTQGPGTPVFPGSQGPQGPAGPAGPTGPQGPENPLPLVGDVDGTTDDNTVAKIRGNAVQPGTYGPSEDGHVLTWVDADGYLELKPASGGGGGSWPTEEPGTVSIPESIVIDSTSGSVRIHGTAGEGVIALESDAEIVLNANTSIYIDADQDVNIDGDTNVQINAEIGHVEILGSGGEGDPGIQMNSGSEIAINANNGLSVNCGNNIEFTTEGSINLTANDSIDIEGEPSVTINTHGTLAFNVSTMGPVSFINMDTAIMNIQAATVNVNSNNNDVFNVYGDSFFSGPVRLTSTFIGNQTGSIAITDLLSPFVSGFYEVSVYLTATNPGSTGTVFATIGYTDGSGSTTQDTPTLTFGSPTRVSARFLAESNNTGALTYSTTAAGLDGAAVYSIRISVTRIG